MPHSPSSPAPRRSRSRSPARAHHRRHRSRSPHRHHHHRHRPKPPPPPTLPCNARPLSKHAFSEYRPLFALYLDVQKQRLIEDLPAEEVRGRWKSFVGRWNRGELAEGWYDPATRVKAGEAAEDVGPRKSPEYVRAEEYAGDEEEGSSDGEVGPALPSAGSPSRRHAGPAIPSLQDLQLQRESLAEDADASHEDLRHARRLDRTEQRARLDELVPRADPGTHERKLEKKAAVNEKMRGFRDKSPGGEVAEADLLGDDGGVEGLKARKGVWERKKNERELRKEEVLRARAEEREERLAEHRAREEKVMQGLRALARQNFGGGG
ncbi:MAG: hypothetical protein M1832_000961 [Thelocarpon impressellum]|nr:MAG: hypothetical protein M1832_000961 [Thelocarpon impressellum]